MNAVYFIAFVSDGKVNAESNFVVHTADVPSRNTIVSVYYDSGDVPLTQQCKNAEWCLQQAF